MKVSKLSISLILFILIFSGLLNAQENFEPIFNQNVAYQYYIDFRYKGPKGWYGTVQINNPVTGGGLYPQLPPNSRAVFIKYSKEEMQKGAHGFNPIVEVQLYKNDNSSTALSSVQTFTSQINPSDFTIQPKGEVIAGREWAVSEFKISDLGFNLRRKVCATSYQNLTLLVQLTTTEEEYSTDVNSFDASISQMWFKDSPNVPSEIEKATPVIPEKAASTERSNVQADKNPINNKKLRLKSGEIVQGKLLFENSDYYRLEFLDGTSRRVMKEEVAGEEAV